MKPFDLINDPLKGVNLIEAAAGTGKTFSIAGLFLRLVVEGGLGLEQILVVTYTKAATEELKHRIRHRLITARRHFSGDREDPWLSELAEKVKDPNLALRRINDALIAFDRAAIFTIHGFCHRVLQQFAFETGHRFQADLVQDLTLLIQEMADDFWRRHISSAPDELAAYALQKLKGPEALIALINACRYPGMGLWPPVKKPRLFTIKPWREIAGEIRRAWPQARPEVIALLRSPALNARFYGRLADKDQDAGTSPRERRITVLVAAMDAWMGTYPLVDRFERLSRDKLCVATKKNHVTPAHPFFDLCQAAVERQSEMERQLVLYLRYLKAKLLHGARHQLDLKMSRRNAISFDDLLLKVARALDQGSNNRLASTIRKQYAAALVDEFQDTDPLQYEIFSGVFGTHGTTLFMIGDPKQAIYSFRGADVFAYLQAAQGATRRYTLARNWRATPELVTAVNTVFAGRANPFGIPEIGFSPALPARRSTRDGVADPALCLWYLTSKPNPQDPAVGKPYPVGEATDMIVDAVAGQIVDLLVAPDAPSAEKIAVLTRSHRQAQKAKAALARRNVPAVLHSAGSVLETGEAEELVQVLKAVMTPGNGGEVRAALATEMLGAGAADFLEDESGGPGAWETRWEHFDTYHQLWTRSGFYRMFGLMVQREGIKTTLLGLPDGERRITNLLHLAELLQAAEIEQRLSPEGLLKWLLSHMGGVPGSDEDQQLRLESDARAVQIITIHKSKGLQYDVVFCPFTWSGVVEQDALNTFHDPSDGHRFTLAVGPDIPPEFKRQGMIEDLAENLRLLYVALTRARERCYWVWGRINKTECSAPAYLLHGPLDASAPDEWVAGLRSRMTALTDEGFLRDLKELVQRSRGTITLAPLPAHNQRLERRKDTVSLGAPRTFVRKLDHHWRITSFSSLTAGQPGMAEGGHDAAPEKDTDALTARVAPGENQGVDHPIFDFPKGARAGLFFHDILEHWSFDPGDTAGRHALIADKLAAYGFEPHWLPGVDDVLTGVAAAALTNPWGPFRLQEVGSERRLAEMAFYFPLNRITPESLRQAFADTRTGGNGDYDFEVALKKLAFVPVEGFLKGYVDLIFEHQGRYYVVDWKSNHLGSRMADYAPDRLDKVIADDFYFLQYHLYVVALDQHLRQRLPAYDFERHFGGVYYLFLRGVPAGEQGNGIYYARPHAGTVETLNRLLVAK